MSYEKVVAAVGIAVFVFAAGIMVGYTTHPEREFPFFEPFDSDKDMWANIMAAYPNYDAMTDLEKTTALRTWASQHLYVSGNLNVYNHNLFDNRHPYKIFNHFSSFHNGDAGVMCSGYAHALCVLYKYAGFPAIKYDYGGDGCSHSVVLVWITADNKTISILQDPYFDYYYSWPNHTVMSVDEIFTEVHAQRYENVVPVYEKTIDYGVFVPLNETEMVQLGVQQHLNGVEFVAGIDEDSAVYRFWYTPENYYKSIEYAENRDGVLQTGIANDMGLLIEKRRIIYFADNPIILDSYDT